LALTYENGVLVRGVTRGDGVMGEDIYPKCENYSLNSFAVKCGETMQAVVGSAGGEAFLLISVFEFLKLIKKSSHWENNCPNPRNAAAGALPLIRSQNGASN
jgi:DNA ligase (NAD+)